MKKLIYKVIKVNKDGYEQVIFAGENEKEAREIHKGYFLRDGESIDLAVTWTRDGRQVGSTTLIETRLS